MIPDPSLLINRELSWLAFNERVLEEAADPSTPLLERVKFASITAANLDEFFMVRVAAVKRTVEEEDAVTDPAAREELRHPPARPCARHVAL